ncbi:restriction endonuclease subunit S [Acinetobacter venetianus]|nr:restriction endonuclease subunit S [Acinetobacter venetianus]
MKSVRFGDLCKLQNGRAFKPEEWSEEGTPIVRIQNLNDETKPFNYCNFDVEKRFWINSGDLLFSWSGTPGTSFGAFFWNRGKGFLNQHIFRVDVKEELVDKHYLRYALNSLIVKIIDQAHGGVGLKHITKAKLEEVQIPLPPLAEQRQIASILDQADELRQKRQQAIEKLDQLLQSTFIEMFGDPVSNPKQFICKTLEQISCFENGDRSSNYPSGNDLVFAGIPFLSTKNIRCNVYDETNLNFITEEKFSSLSRGKVKNNEILITLRGTLGATCIFKSKYDTAFINAQMMIIRSNPLIMSNDFLHAILSFESMQEYFRRVGQGAAVPQLTATQLKKLEIIIPSIELQNEFLRINQEIQKLKNEFSNSFSKYDLLFKSLQNQAFSGTL